MKYLLDTNIIIYLKDPHSEHYDTVGRHFLKKLANDSEVYVSLLTLYEVEVGVSFSGKKSHSKHQKSFCFVYIFNN